MTIVEELESILISEFERRGIYTIVLTRLQPVSGYWRSQDVYRWEASAKAESIPPNWKAKPRLVSIVSWEAMTDVVRAHRRFLRGKGKQISISSDDPYHFEVSR